MCFNSFLNFLVCFYFLFTDGVLATYENEKSLLAKAKELHNQLSTERVKLEEKSQQSTANNIQVKTWQKIFYNKPIYILYLIPTYFYSIELQYSEWYPFSRVERTVIIFIILFVALYIIFVYSSHLLYHTYFISVFRFSNCARIWIARPWKWQDSRKENWC